MADFCSTSDGLPVIGSDFSRLEGTCCYCSAESETQIRLAIEGQPLEAIHMIGTGDYHYISLFWLERIDEAFVLILFDNHPDDQPTAFGGDMLSCGSWVANARTLPSCKGDIWIRHKDDIRGIQECGLPLYISVDLDVLSREYARTDWDQGTMSLDELCSAISALRATHRIIGADICGGITEAQGGTASDLALNAATAARIIGSLRG